MCFQVPPPKLDSLGRQVSQKAPDQWPARCGVGVAVRELVPHLQSEQISTLFKFFVDRGLKDRNEEVRKEMLAAALTAVNTHGKVRHHVHTESLIVHVEAHL